MIRKRVVAVSVAVFLALWAIVFAQLVSDRDSALANSKSANVLPSTTATTTSSSDDSAPSSPSSPTAVSTRQS